MRVNILASLNPSDNHGKSDDELMFCSTVHVAKGLALMTAVEKKKK